MTDLLDANIFMAAKDPRDDLDFCSAFWDWLVHNGNTDTGFSIDKVADEIEAGQDELSEWARNHGHALFRRTPPTLAPRQTNLFCASEPDLKPRNSVPMKTPATKERRHSARSEAESRNLFG